ncbi:putative restriction endonuclease [Shimia thalassica]|uniref:Putative restriction endonuclease n=2 Tax=Shimia thalassica TaxID=1715693 RepID=A0A0P1I634_9RHOB|nr:putative restriction endonuclease [Shimia thalassica]
MLHEQLARLAREYVFERVKRFAGSEFANFVRHDISVEAKKRLIFLPYDLEVKASVGQSQWASVPWLDFFDPIVTDTATRGFYVVYLINADTEEIVLSLNQGTTEVYEEFGDNEEGRRILARRAIEMAERVADFSAHFDNTPIDLGSNSSLPKGYEAGHAFGRVYKANQIDPVLFYTDLENMLSAYRSLVDRGGRTPIDSMMDQSGSTDILETRKFVLSKRIERAKNVRLPVLERRGLKCEGCGLEPTKHYNYQGPIKNIPLDVHHAMPIRELSEGETRRYKIPDDFLVLCPTCHRVIHKQNDEADVEQLRDSVRFLFASKPR